MGTRYSAVFFAPPGMNASAIGARLFCAVDAVDRQMSSWQPDSDLNRLNRAPEHEWLTVPEGLFSVLGNALSVGRESRGAFDIGVGDLVGAWGFGPGDTQVDEQRISNLKAQPYRTVVDILDIVPA